MAVDHFKRLRDLGGDLSPTLFAETAAIFAAAAPRPDGLVVQRDVSYGAHERQRLDIFSAPPAAGDRPVLVYVHGGGFVGGDKAAPDSPFYDNVGAWAARHGMVGITMNYRLAPGHRWPSGAEDIAASLDTVRRAVVAIGGSPEKIFLMGQSAGAAHVASYVAAPQLHRGEAVAGAIMLSGLYDVPAFPQGDMEKAYYGANAAALGDMSSINGLVAADIPCLFGIAELDPGKFQLQASLLVREWTAARGRFPRLFHSAGHNHVSPVLSLGVGDDRVGRAVTEFIDDVRPRQG